MPERNGYIRRLPVSVFGVCLGTAGQVPMWNSLANSKAMKCFDIPQVVAQVFWVIAVVLLTILAALYCWKIVLHPRSVRTEFHCYYQSNFFTLPFLCLIILSASLPPAWFAGEPSPLLLLLLVPLVAIHVYLYGEWMYGVNRSLRLANPAFQLAVVGNFFGSLLASNAGQSELAIGLFTVGIMYLSLTLACLHAANTRIKRDCTGAILQEQTRRRLVKLDEDLHPLLESTPGRVQHNPWSPMSEIWALPPGLHPTIFLCLAPPSVAALAWANINDGECDRLCKSLVSIPIFFLLTMSVHLHRFFRRTPFSLASWAFTFPSAALGTASIKYAEYASPGFSYLSFALCSVAITFWTMATLLSLYMLGTRGLTAFLSPGSEKTSDVHFLVGGAAARLQCEEGSLEVDRSVVHRVHDVEQIGQCGAPFLDPRDKTHQACETSI
eukprot:scpid52197/ scgid18587/ S-type anion channel SLAH3; SLAC1-homolog protein 3